MRNTGPLVAIVFAAFGVTLAAAVISRLSDQTMTMLTGAACGAGLVVPFAILGGMYFGSQRAARDRPPAQPQPPIVVMTPPQPSQPATPMLPTWSSVSGMPAPSPRQYTILGEETVIDGNDRVL